MNGVRLIGMGSVGVGWDETPLSNVPEVRIKKKMKDHFIASPSSSNLFKWIFMTFASINLFCNEINGNVFAGLRGTLPGRSKV